MKLGKNVIGKYKLPLIIIAAIRESILPIVKLALAQADDINLTAGFSSFSSQFRFVANSWASVSIISYSFSCEHNASFNRCEYA